MTLEDFRAFEADFVAKGALVTDKRDNEEWDLLNLKLPPNWKGRLLEQESNQCANKFWVRVSNLPDIGPKKLQRLLERSAHIRIKKFKTADGSILYECRSESDQGLLLDLDGSKVGGKKIQVVRGMVHMSVSEAFAWIKRKLGTIEEAERYETEMSVRAVQHGDSLHEGSEEEYGSLQTQSAPHLVGPVRSVQQQSHSGGSQGKGGAPKRSGSNPQSSQHQAKPPNSRCPLAQVLRSHRVPGLVARVVCQCIKRLNALPTHTSLHLRLPPMYSRLEHPYRKMSYTRSSRLHIGLKAYGKKWALIITPDIRGPSRTPSPR